MRSSSSNHLKKLQLFLPIAVLMKTLQLQILAIRFKRHKLHSSGSNHLKILQLLLAIAVLLKTLQLQILAIRLSAIKCVQVVPIT